MNGKVVGLYICPVAGQPMQAVQTVEAIAGRGLKGDRYATRQGSWNRKLKWFFQKWLRVKRQVTLIAEEAFVGTMFEHHESRRNIVVEGVDLQWLIGKKFWIGNVKFYGVKYCEPCGRPSKLCKKGNFERTFHDKGGLVAAVIKGGRLAIGDVVISPPKKK